MNFIFSTLTCSSWNCIFNITCISCYRIIYFIFIFTSQGPLIPLPHQRVTLWLHGSQAVSRGQVGLGKGREGLGLRGNRNPANQLRGGYPAVLPHGKTAGSVAMLPLVPGSLLWAKTWQGSHQGWSGLASGSSEGWLPSPEALTFHSVFLNLKLPACMVVKIFPIWTGCRLKHCWPPEPAGSSYSSSSYPYASQWGFNREPSPWLFKY